MVSFSVLSSLELILVCNSFDYVSILDERVSCVDRLFD